ncbi:MAG: zf-HC2 domain-containing protein [Blastocatellia bacterium]
MNFNVQTECRAVEDSLVALAANELDAELSAQLRAHVDDCANCQSSLAEIRRAGLLAGELKLVSPELDRYPEFLRRLAASEAQAAREIVLEGELVSSVGEVLALTPIKASMELKASEIQQAGAAAVIPLFGHRLIIRSGFGRGFDLQVSSRQNRELFHLSANSLAKAAAVVAGFGMFAALSLFALGMLVVWMVRQAAPTFSPPSAEQIHQQEPMPHLGERRLQNFGEQKLPWLQTVAGDGWALAMWKAGNQVQAGFIEPESGALSDPFILALPNLGTPAANEAAESRITDCSLATDGQSVVAVREQMGNVFVWHLQPSSNKPRAGISPMPIVIGSRAFQPAIAWAGDRYLVVWIEPDRNFPKLKMVELDRAGRPLQPAALTVAETESANLKVGTPSIVAQSGRALIVYQRQGNSLMARSWDSTAGMSEAPVELLRHKGQMINRPVLAAIGGKFLVCWGENYPEGSELRWGSVNPVGEVEKLQTLAVSRMPIISFDFKASGKEMSLIWSEAAEGGAQIFAQRYSPTGRALSRAINVTPSEIPPMAFAFANAEATTMVWHEARPIQMQSPVLSKRIKWND